MERNHKNPDLAVALNGQCPRLDRTSAIWPEIEEYRAPRFYLQESCKSNSALASPNKEVRHIQTKAHEGKLMNKAEYRKRNVKKGERHVPLSWVYRVTSRPVSPLMKELCFLYIKYKVREKKFRQIFCIKYRIVYVTVPIYV